MSLLSSYLERTPTVVVDCHSAAMASSLADSILPDPLAAKDLVRADGRAVAALIQRREFEERLPLRRALVRYPKGFNSDAYRLVTSLDIVDQLAFRIAAGPCARALAVGLPASVLAHRTSCDGLGVWRTTHPRNAWRDRRDRTLEALTSSPTAHLLVMDVANYYPTLSQATLTSSMNSLGVSSFGVELVNGFLNALHGLPGTAGGVPVGPDASAVLGTAGLISVDRLIHDTTFCRWVDDIWVFVESEASAHSLAELVGDHLTKIGLRENSEKRKVLTGNEALNHVIDAEIDYVARPGHRVSVDEAMDLISSGIAEQKLGRVRFGLGSLKAHESTAAVHIFLANPDLIDADPKAIGSYFGSVMSHIDEHQRELLVDLVTNDADDHQIGRRIHVAGALGRVSLREEHCAQLQNAALAMSSRKHQLIRTHAFVAACRGAGVEKRLDEGLQCAEVTDSLDLRRAIGDAHRRTSGRRRRVGIAQLCRIDPEVRPFLEHLR